MADMVTAPSGERSGVLDGVLIGVVRLSDGANWIVGKAVSWLTLGTVLACFATVYTRYAMGMNFMWLQELYIWKHVAVIALGAGYTMMTGGFVRVDVFYANWSDRRRAIADMTMTVLLLGPFLWIFSQVSWNFFWRSWLSDEGSMNPQGLTDLWLLKFTVVMFCVLVGLQGLAILARGTLVLTGRKDWALRHAGPSADAIH